MNSFSYVDRRSLLMCRVIPLIPLLITQRDFNYTTYGYKKTIHLIIYSVLFLVLACFIVTNHFLFLFFLELTIMPISVFLVIYRKDKEKLSSTCFMFLINIMGSFPFIIGSSGIGFYSSYPLILRGYNSFNRLLLIFCFSLVLLCKLPIFILHFWLTKAHVAGSGSCSMVLARLILKMGSYGLVKFFRVSIKKNINILRRVASFRVLGCLIFCVYMIRFFDVKLMIACSSIIHISLIFPLASLCEFSGICGRLFIITRHGISSYFLFFLITLIYETSHNRSIDFNKSLERLRKTICSVFYVYIFINLGVPPMINFVRELLYCKTFLTRSIFILVPLLLFILIRVLFTMFFCTKYLFGKKCLIPNSDQEVSLYTSSFFFVIFLISIAYFF